MTAEVSPHSRSRSTTQFAFWFDESESESSVTTDGQSASLSWCQAPIWDLQLDFYYCQTFAGLLTWGALSYERMGLSFTIAAGPRQRSHSWVRVPWNSWPYFTVSDSRLLFSSPPTTRRVKVEVFDPASTTCTYIVSRRTHRKNRFCCQECIFIGPLPSNGHMPTT
jgi:hypothetical protein